METYYLKDDLKIFGVQVKTFPNGISETFDALVKMLPGGFDRSFYGLSYMKDGVIVYIAGAIENYERESEKYNCQEWIIEKGEYLTETVKEWRQKIDSIKDVCHALMHDSRADRTKPLVEWYKNEQEMWCMVRSK